MICIACPSFAKFMVTDQNGKEKPACTLHSIRFKEDLGLSGRPLTASERQNHNGHT